MEEIYETEVWKNLEKNAIFKNKIEEILNKSSYYIDKNDINMTIRGTKLVISYHSKIMNREDNCQFVRNTKYELFLDRNNNLIVNELTGFLRSNYGYDFDNTFGGVLDTNYTCTVYDEDGIELAYQSYSDKYPINKSQFSVYKGGFLVEIESIYNPRLATQANANGRVLHADIPGETGRFVRQIRKKDNLGIVISSTCEFDKYGNTLNPKEEYYFNTFLSNQASLNPVRISFTRDYPFATLDENKEMKFNKIYLDAGITPNNYKMVAQRRLLKELIEEKEQNGRHISKDVIDKYDLMIEKLSNGSMERTK